MGVNATHLEALRTSKGLAGAVSWVCLILVFVGRVVMSCNGGWGSEMLSAQMPPCPAVFGCYINGGGKNQPIFPELQSATEI